ncbi:MAG: heparinase II/III family protein, partial [Oscillospiraceae bacterium]|nr:heparinase II/III family protein [Oscillospiraceae bacterium]
GVDTSTNAATDSPAVGAKLKLDAGEYYLLFALDGSHETQEFNAKDRYFANLVSFELKASAEKFENIGLSLDGVEKEDPIAQYSMRKINVSFTDRMGITFSDGDFKEVPEISVSCKMQSEDGGDIECAVSKDGQWYLDAACMTGKGKVFASVTYEGKTRNAELDFTVAEVGKNLLDAEKHNTGFENDNWVWTSAPLADAEPAEDELWWRYYMIDEDSDGNRALKCVTNPKYSAADQYGLKANGAPYKPPALNFVDGEQTRIKVRAGGFYQLSYKIKIEDWQTPVGYPNMSINNTLYAMTDEGKGLPAIPGSYSTKNLSAEEGYVEKYSDWKTVTFPIYAPIKGETDAEYVYLSPSIYITPPTNTALKGAGYGGTVWLDDFELREVGYKDIEVAYSGITDTGVESVVSVSVTPRTTTGEYISFSEKCLEDLTFISSDTDVLGDIQHIDCAESYTGSGVWRGSTAGRLGGKNGTTFLQAEMTLNGVTRSGMNTLSSSGFRQRLFSINASAKALEMSEESTSRINVTGTMSDGTDASEALGSAEFIYKSLTPDIVSVSADGVVAPLAVGTGIVEVTVATEGAVLKTDAQIEVTPASGDGINPDTVSLYVTDNEAGYQREERIYLSAQTSNGYTVHDSYFVSLAKEEKLEWEYDSQNILITRNDDGFYISGEKLGTTSQLKAKISLGEEEKAVSVSVTVVKRDPRDVIIDFGKTSAVKVQDVTLQKDGWEVDAESSYTLPALMGSYMNFRPEGPERDLVINVNIPYDGYYSMMLVGSGHGYKAAEDVDIYLDGAYAGDYCFYNNGGSGVIPAETFRTFHLEKGVHTILFRAQKNTLTVTNPLTGEVLMQNATDEYVQNIRMVCFNALEELPVISGIDAVDELSVETGKERKLDVKILFEDGTSHIWQSPLSDGADDYSVTYEIVDGNDIVTVSADGVISAGETTGIAKVEIIARDSISGKQAKKTVAVDVTEQGADDYIFKSLEIRAEKFTMKPYEKGIELHASALAKSGNEFNLDSASFSWALSAQDALMAESDALEKSFTVKPSGAGKEGTAIVTLTVTLADGSTHTAEKQVSVRNGKTESTYYTSERVANARENIRKYKWAKSQKDTAVKKADTYMQRGMDEMWRMIPGEGMPRVIWIGFNGDNDKFKCRYCGVNAQLETGSGYPWLTNALTRPWKIQCPSCKRVFPSNDFESFYELGVSASNDGVFDIETALKAHAEKFGGKTYGYGYLKNDLYPELRNTGKDPLYNCDITHGWDIDYALENIADVWGVDDGAGYDTGRKNETGARIVYPYIGYYLHEGLWHGGEIEAALNAFRDAYVYTGDEKYGRIGAVMLDRIADLYPDMSIRPWDSKGYYVGNTNSGKITNDTWEPSFAKEFALAYDAFFDMYDDSAVQQFIQHKAEEFPGILVDSDKNPRSKETALDIRENIEENILLEAYDAVWSYDMSGNFGGHQSVLAFVAIVYDNEPKTTEMIEWIFNEEITDRKSFNAGGGVGSKYVNEVSRDGQGTESGPGYNELWVNGTMNLAEALEFYKGDYENSNLWTHPKYLTMIRSYNPLTLLHRGLPPIGDSGSMGKYSALPDTPELLLNAYKNVTEKMETTEDPEEKQALRESAVEIAQLYYRIFVKDDDFSGARLDIFTKDPESIQDELASIIEEYGEYDYDKSSMLSGYGFAALRDGKLFESVGGNSIKDTTRDFWMYFGGASSHAHADALELNVDAYGISMTSDNGYPEATGTTPSRTQWTNVTLSHNTVVVNESNQNVLQKTLKPLHFDAKDTRVKVLDVDGAEVYPETDEYRRTVVMIDYDDEISYGVDFFKVLGGNDHTYSFHASGDSVHDTNLDDMENYFVQKGGTYAGADVAFGNDPYTNAASTSGKLKYPSGYTWLENIRKVEKPENDGFYVDYNIKDVAGISRNPKNMMDIHLRLTMLNDWRADEIVLAQSVPPRRSGWDDYISRYEYMLVRRKGEQLNTLFTTVIEPYNKERYITGIARVGIEPSSETSVHPSKTDKAAALKIELRDGRIDYVVYAQNGDVTYTVTDGDYSFDFKGFVGVWTVNADNRNVYSYLNDAEILADIKGMDAAISGEVTGFTEELSLSNYIEVNFDRAITDEEAENLADRMINVEFKNSGNAAYVIRGVKELSPDGTSAKLDIGNITPINSYKDMDAGTYNYDVAV